jgi:hypothetical protein
MNINEELEILITLKAELLEWRSLQPLWHKQVRGFFYLDELVDNLDRLIDNTLTRGVFESYQEKLMNHKEKDDANKDTN